MQLTPAVILFSAKSCKIIQDAIMAEQVPCFQFRFYILNVYNSDHFDESSGEVAYIEILLSRYVDYFMKGIK